MAAVTLSTKTEKKVARLKADNEQYKLDIAAIDDMIARDEAKFIPGERYHGALMSQLKKAREVYQTRINDNEAKIAALITRDIEPQVIPTP